MESTVGDFQDDDVEASRSYAAVSAQLESWTSPKVGNLASNWGVYEDAVQWMETSPLGKQKDHISPSIDVTPPRSPIDGDSTPGTPIMSNSAKKSTIGQLPIDLMDVPSISKAFSASATSDNYRLYHDAMLRFLRSDQATNQLAILGESQSNSKDQLMIDLEYLQTLAGDNNALWSLLLKLRSLGLDAIWMDDTESTEGIQQRHISDTLQKLSSPKLLHTHAQVIQSLYEESSPMFFRRRKALFQWLQENNARRDIKLPRKISSSQHMWPESTKAIRRGITRPDKIQSVHPDAPFLISESREPLFGGDGKHEKDLLQACLNYILAGRLDKATQLCKAHGQPWRAAVWQGGQPFMIGTIPNKEKQSMVDVNMGNPCRLMWKSQCRKLASVTVDEEAAIYSVLANDTQKALTSPCLRSWESGLYICLSSMVERLEDELIHLYNAQLRKSGRVLPGNNFEQEELDHLLATANAAMFSEKSIMNTLASSPYEEMKGKTIYQQIMTAFIQGRAAVISFLQSQCSQSEDEQTLRTVTHLMLFIYSLSTRPGSPVQMDGLGKLKEDCLLRYLDHLATRPDLVQFSVVYAAMLPTDTMLNVYPKLLTKVQVPSERKELWEQMKELFKDGVDLRILKSIVQLMIADKDLNNVQKCQSIGWLSFTQDHYEEALKYANAIVRQLLLNEEASVANEFLWEYFPRVVQSEEQEGLISTRREHDALQVFLEANEAFENWKECMTETSETPSFCKKDELNKSKLNAMEKEIALSMEKRQIIEEKQKVSGKIIDAANAARCKLNEVLTFDGGWLQEYDDEDDIESSDEIQRAKELKQLQSELIPQVVFMAHNVYNETATWMKNMLEDAIPLVGNTENEVLCVLAQDGGDSPTTTPLAPLYWLRHAEGLAKRVASEEYNIYDCFGQKYLRRFLGYMEDVFIRILEESAS